MPDVEAFRYLLHRRSELIYTAVMAEKAPTGPRKARPDGRLRKASAFPVRATPQSATCKPSVKTLRLDLLR
jgi:hypothetical protein